MSKQLIIGGATLNQTPLDWEGNTENILDAIQQAHENRLDILCLPELCITGYGCEDAFLSQWVHQKALKYLLKIAVHCKEVMVAIGLPLWFEGKLYNAVAFAHQQKVIGFYAKQRLANDGVHYEPRWFSPWPANKNAEFKIDDNICLIGDQLIAFKGIKIGVEICEDAWHDVRPACRYINQKVDLILNPSASHFAFGKSKFRENLISQSSSTFKCTYFYVNLLGNEAGRMIYDGDILLAQNGKIHLQNERFSYKNINLAYAKVDFSNQMIETNFKHDQKDREIEFTRATTLGLFDYLRKTRSNGFVISLSGGADSATCAILVAEMVKQALNEISLPLFLKKIGQTKWGEEISEINEKDRTKWLCHRLLTCAYQGTQHSSRATFNSAKAIAEDIGAQFYHWSIQEEVNLAQSKMQEVIGRPLNWKDDDIALQNIQARGRSPLIWMLTNIKGALLLTTSNRSEGDVGYATMDGDTSGGLAPIAGVDKVFIIHWLNWIEKNGPYPGLQFVNNLQPSAELRPGESQRDEDDLMPYTILLKIEQLAIGKYLGPVSVYQALKQQLKIKPELLKQHITKFFRLWSYNQWKRERLAPSFHLDAFNIDPRSWYRFPILSGGFRQELEELQNISE